MKTICLLLATFAATAGAQITNPDKLVAPAPKPFAPRAVPELRASDLQWLWQYAKPEPTGNKSALFADPRFAALLHSQLIAPQGFWGTNRPLSEAASDFLAGEGTVSSRDNRYLTVTGCVADQCQQKGLLWFDLGSPKPIMVFVAKRWMEAGKTPDEKGAPFQYWVFPNRSVGASLPIALRTTLGQWESAGQRASAKDCPAANQPLGVAVVVDVDGTPHLATSIQIGINTLCTSNS